MSEELEEVVTPEGEQETSPEITEEVLEESKESPDITTLQEKLNKEADARRQLTARAQKAEANNKILEARLKETRSSDESANALDFIKLGKKLQDYSDEEIDFATEYAKSKSPDAILKALDNEMVQLAIQSKRQKIEKERTLSPSNKQSETEKPRTLTERLQNATMAEKEEILTKAGLFKQVRPRSDRTLIGGN